MDTYRATIDAGIAETMYTAYKAVITKYNDAATNYDKDVGVYNKAINAWLDRGVGEDIVIPPKPCFYKKPFEWMAWTVDFDASTTAWTETSSST